MTGKRLILLCGVLFAGMTGRAQTQNADDGKVPIFTPFETSFNFGTIGEHDGNAEHVFRFKNTGTAPLVILNVQTTCGCTRPEWTVNPVEPGDEGVIIITYNPIGRIGPFNKPATLQTNENGGYKRYKLTIMGEVVEKPSDPVINFQDTLSGVGVEIKHLVLPTFDASSVNKIATYIKNYHDQTVYFAWEDVPDYMTIKAPDSLKAEWPGEIILSIDGVKTAEKRGRVTEKCTWVIKNRQGGTLGRETICVTVNYLDDFSQLSPLQLVTAPVLEIKNALLDFGTIKKSGFGKGKAIKKPFILTNTGKSDLIIHSITIDDERVNLPDLKGKTIKAGESLNVDATIRSKLFGSGKLDTDIYIVANDPKGPVRRIKVMAATF